MLSARHTLMSVLRRLRVLLGLGLWLFATPGHAAPRVGLPAAARAAYAKALSCYDELAFDSIAALRLLIVVEELAGVIYPPEVIPPIYTVGEAFNYYRDLLEDITLPRW